VGERGPACRWWPPSDDRDQGDGVTEIRTNLAIGTTSGMGLGGGGLDGGAA
jgi:hypothetical protein